MKSAGKVIELCASSWIILWRAWITRNDLRSAERNCESHIGLVIVRQCKRFSCPAVEQSLTVDHIKEWIVLPIWGINGLRLHSPSNIFRKSPWAENASIHDTRKGFTIHF